MLAQTLRNVVGTLSSYFQAGGLLGPRWTVNGTAWEARVPNGSSLTITRGADPVGNTDFVTKQYFVANGGSSFLPQTAAGGVTTVPTDKTMPTIGEFTIASTDEIVLDGTGELAILG